MNDFDSAVKCIQKGDFLQAEKILLQIAATEPQDFDANHMLGVVCTELNKFDQAETFFKIALSIDSRYPPLYKNYGLFLSKTKHFDEAIEQFNAALRLLPNYAPVYSDRGNAMKELNKLDEAIADHNHAIALAPGFFGFYKNRGNALIQKKQLSEALSDFDVAIKLNPHFADAHCGRGNVFFSLRLYDKAFAAYDRAFAIDPNLDDAESMRFISKLHVCNWSNFDAEKRHFIASMKEGKAAPPMVSLAVSDSPEDQLQCARVWVSKKNLVSASSSWKGEIYRHKKIRVGYFSADFRQHALAFLTAEMFEKHDRAKFEIIGLSFGPETKDEMQERLRGTFDKFIDVQAQSDRDVALLARNQEIDIAVDLNGFTQHARTGIFSMRPAPIQVSYLGYPGTMGANYIDYLIADRTVIPEASLPYYTEKIVYLPNSYQVSSKRPISESPHNRVESGLPQSSFVFCCFNNNHKITPGVFDCWMRILQRVDDSVLWLLEDNTTAKNNLQKEAAARGINSERIIFAKRALLPDHLARHRLADLFLDTLPYNAHTTGSDALWAGLPVLTQIGETFAGRVGASLLTAIGLPELIMHSREEYEALAIELALNRERLLNIKEKLNKNRLMMPLFDTALFTQHLEAAYEAMYQRYLAGRPPDHMQVPSS